MTHRLVFLFAIALGACSADCPVPQAKCGASCFDVRIDPSNCGFCGVQCKVGEVCASGKCGIACGAGLTACGTTCADMTSDARHCGDCANACGQGLLCSNSKCVSACPSDETQCGTQCKNLHIDPAACGDCNTACMGGLVCVAGKCGCPTGLTACGSACIDLQSDVAHCGSCATACPTGNVCSGGTCTITCSAGQTNCGGSCVSLPTDPTHCGGCSTICPPGNLCSSGVCSVTCQAGLQNCGGQCTNVQLDTAHCGDCTTQCAAGKVCSGGLCVLSCQTSLTNCSGTCTNLMTDPQHCGDCNTACGAGRLCQGGTCKPSCQQPLTTCGNTCVDPRYDPDNCNGCSMPCPSVANGSRGCNAGQCTVAGCQAPFKDCDGNVSNGCEANLTTDNLNCGACGFNCTNVTNGSGGCQSSKCVISSCNTGFKDCDGNYFTGCETDLRSDPNNCGACGTKCNTGSGTCSNGVCSGFPESVLINGSQAAQINTWVGNSTQQWTLCYRMSRDGSATSTFHSRCDNRGATVTIINLNNGNRLMGGYNADSWNSGSGWLTNPSCFMFSLTNSYKHTYIGSFSTYNTTSYGPTFGGGHDFHAGSTNIGNGAYCNFGYSYQCRTGGTASAQCYNDVCGTYNPSITDLEVFVRQGS